MGQEWKTRAEKLADMTQNIWSVGKWYSRDGDIEVISEMDDKRVMSVAYHLKDRAVSTIHFLLFKHPHDEQLRVRYKVDFPNLVMDYIKVHPSWPFIKKEINDRDLYFNLR